MIVLRDPFARSTEVMDCLGDRSVDQPAASFPKPDRESADDLSNHLEQQKGAITAWPWV